MPYPTFEDASGQTTLNIPSIIGFAVLSILAIRYFFFSPSSASSSSTAPGARPRITPQKIDQVAMMFPQLSRRDIEWDLVRNGGSVQATTEKVLRSGRLEAPPPNFRAQEVPQSTTSVTSGTGSGASAQRGRGTGQQPQKPQYPDLITRYNLSSRVGTTTSISESEDSAATSGRESPVGLGQGSKGGWSQNKNDRQVLLKKRREEMVLQARRKMEERDRLAAAGAKS